MNELLQHATDCRKTVNEAYKTLLTTVHAEMDESLNYKDIGPTAHKKADIWANLGGMIICKIYGTM